MDVTSDLLWDKNDIITQKEYIWGKSNINKWRCIWSKAWHASLHACCIIYNWWSILYACFNIRVTRVCDDHRYSFFEQMSNFANWSVCLCVVTTCEQPGHTCALLPSKKGVFPGDWQSMNHPRQPSKAVLTVGGYWLVIDPTNHSNPTW